MLDKGRPVYTIGTAAEILGIHPRTLRLYEDGGLIRPARKNNRRFYSPNDLQWISCLRYMMHEQGLNQEGLRRLLALIPCWDIQDCPPETRASCAACTERSVPCWELARRSGDSAKKCYQCQTYLSAKDYVLDPQEVGRAMNYALVA